METQSSDAPSAALDVAPRRNGSRSTIARSVSPAPTGSLEPSTGRTLNVNRPAAGRRVPCHHLHDTTTRYGCIAEVLSFLLVCTVCGTARVVETGATSRASSPAPTTGAAPRSATPHEAARLDRSTLAVAGVATLAYCGRCNAESL